MKIEPVLLRTLRKVSRKELTTGEAFDTILDVITEELNISDDYSFEQEMELRQEFKEIMTDSNRRYLKLVKDYEELEESFEQLSKLVDCLEKKHKEEKAELVKEICRLENKLNIT